MAFEKYTIKEFENAWFGNDRSVISEEEFGVVYTEYIDVSGLFKTEDFERVVYIQYVNDRINGVKLSIKLQHEFIEEFGVPYNPGFEFFKSKGHRLKWDGNKEDFIKQLEKIQLKENKWISVVESKIKELKEFRAKHHKKETSVEQNKSGFIRMINSLRKQGWVIDKTKDTVEELANIVKQQLEEQK